MRHPRKLILLALCTLIWLMGCSGGDTNGADHDGCVPGRVVECDCNGGQPGAQTCDEAGNWGACQCLDDAMPDAGPIDDDVGVDDTGTGNGDADFDDADAHVDDADAHVDDAGEDTDTDFSDADASAPDYEEPTEVDGHWEWYIEAEDFDLQDPHEVDSDDDASGGQYVVVRQGEHLNDPPDEPGGVRTVYIPETRSYYMWVRIYGPDPSNDAYWIGFADDSPEWWRVYPNDWNTYVWSRVSDSPNDHELAQPLELEEGEQTLQISFAQVDARLDAIFLTSDPDRQP